MSKPAIVSTLEPVPGSIGVYQEVKRFGNANLQASIDRAIASMGTADKGFEVTFEADQKTGINTAIVLKLNGHWSVAGAFHAKGRDDMAVGFGVSGRW
jgi:hypothetical protein